MPDLASLLESLRPTPPEPLPEGLSKPTWVVVDVQGHYPAQPPASPIAALLNRQDSLEAFEKRLEALAGADWLHGVLFRIGALEVGLATAWALGRAIERLSKEKRTLAYSPRLDMRSLLVASGAREVAAPESAELDLRGLFMEVTFLGEFLGRHGIGFENLRIREYKSALTRFSEREMDPYDREQREALLRSMEAAWVRELAGRRNRSEAEVQGWLSGELTSAEGARAAGLIDRLAYEDELIGPATRPVADVAKALDAKQGGLAALLPGAERAGRVALVGLHGAIVPGRSRNVPLPLPLFGGPQAGSDSVLAALRRALRDQSTKAVVFQVDSGGGSALASDLIWREVARAKKPVVAVMGEVAASGGYYVLTHARHIVAAPHTITGSIGVVSGKPVLEAFNAKYGFKAETVQQQPQADLYSAARPLSPEGRAILARSIEEVYHRFTARVAEGRGLSQERVNEIGRGRIWSGADALEIGLIDELGDLKTAVERACELAGLPYDAPVWHAEPPRGPVLPAVDFGPAAFGWLKEPALLLLDTTWQLR